MLKTCTSLVFMNNLNQSVFRGTGKNVHAIIPKGNMGYNQCTVAHTAAVEPTFVAFLWHTQKYVHDLSSHSFKFR